jgi:predicted RNA-binding Zn ribbon-like protein
MEACLPERHRRADPGDFRLHSDRLCLDFVATLGSRDRWNIERLRTPDDLKRWLTIVGLPGEGCVVRKGDLIAARALREAIHRVVTGTRSKVSGSAEVALLNQWARRKSLSPQLEAHGRTKSWIAEPTPKPALCTIARDAIDLVSGPHLSLVRQCQGEDCTILFVDTSRAGHRRWCSMEECGNRNKAKSFRERHSIP